MAQCRYGSRLLLAALLLLDIILLQQGALARNATPAASTEQLAAGEVNVILLMADQMRFDVMGVANNPVAMTPNLDKLSSEGMLFTNAYSSTPTCTPARAAILTGLNPWNHGMIGYGSIAHRYPLEIARYLSSVGYMTHSIGKDHFGWNKSLHEGVPHGYDSTMLYDGLLAEDDDYDQWFHSLLPGVDAMETGLTFNDYRGRAYALPEYYHPTAWVGRHTVEWLDAYDSTQPFMLKASFHRPHSPYDPPERVMNLYDPDKMPRPYRGDSWDDVFATKFNKTPDPGIWCGNITWEDLKTSRQAYYASVTYVDEWIGMIYDMLQMKGLLDNTLIIFTADHGDMLGDHYHYRKGYPYEGSAHVPFIIRWPNKNLSPANGGPVVADRGSRSDKVVELRDIFPTFAEASGHSLESAGLKVDGASVLALLRASPANSDGMATAAPWRQWIDMEHDICYNVTNHWNSLTDGKMKYIFNAYSATEQLFNLTADSAEYHDLAAVADYQTELKTWRERLVDQFVQEQRGPVWVQNGQLMRRVKGQTYSPNYPKTSTSPAARVV
ncbi:arylsulfatase-like isoform X2 [Sycon ciliatum]|uniref:arylsulfatase-like isoform X2 n=1 Tax=Sycon ciliatum TaxID=27933 RepID=UPI0031F627C5